MPLSFQVDTPRRLIRTRAYGLLNRDEVMEYFRGLRANGQFRPSFSELVDLSEASGMSITASEISQLATVRVFESTARRALVARSTLIFGLCRMFTAYSAFNGQHSISVFSEMETARVWLGLAANPDAESLQIAS